MTAIAYELAPRSIEPNPVPGIDGGGVVPPINTATGFSGSGDEGIPTPPLLEDQMTFIWRQSRLGRLEPEVEEEVWKDLQSLHPVDAQAIGHVRFTMNSDLSPRPLSFMEHITYDGRQVPFLISDEASALLDSWMTRAGERVFSKSVLAKDARAIAAEILNLGIEQGVVISGGNVVRAMINEANRHIQESHSA